MSTGRGRVGASAAAAAAVLLLSMVAATEVSAATPLNLLTTDQATVETTATGFGNGYSASVARSTAVAAEGSASLAVTATVTKGMAARTAGGVAVAPGTTVTASAEARVDAGVAAPSKAMVQLRFWTASGASAGVSNGSWTSVSGTAWTRLTKGSTAVPVTAATVSVFVVVQATAVGDRYFTDKWGLWAGSTLPVWSAPGSGSAGGSAPDTTPPSPVPSITVVPDTASGRLAVSWSAATDDAGVTAYRVFLSPAPGSGTGVAPSAIVSTRSWTSGALAPGDHVVEVLAVDAAGNVSASSTPVTTTLASPPPPPPAPAPGTNVLTVNQADVEASTLGFEVAYGGTSIARSSDSAVHGASSLMLTSTSTASFAVRTARTWTTVTGGLPYAASVSVRAGALAAPGRRVLVQLRSFDANGAQVAVANSAWVSATPGAWVRVTAVSTPPAAAARVSIHLVAETAAVGDTYLADAWGLWQSATVPTWSLPAADTAASVALFLGDSYAAGAGATTTSRRWTSVLSAQRGWLEANLARGGTGYLKTATTTGCGLAYCPTFREMTADAVAARPDIVVVSGGRNDLTLVTTDPSGVHQAVLDTYAALRQGLPSSRIYAITPMWDASTPPSVLQTLRGWVAEAAAQNDVTLVDGAETWLLGHPEWITSDKVHPNDLGYAQLAQRVGGSLG